MTENKDRRGRRRGVVSGDAWVYVKEKERASEGRKEGWRKEKKLENTPAHPSQASPTTPQPLTLLLILILRAFLHAAIISPCQINIWKNVSSNKMTSSLMEMGLRGQGWGVCRWRRTLGLIGSLWGRQRYGSWWRILGQRRRIKMKSLFRQSFVRWWWHADIFGGVWRIG